MNIAYFTESLPPKTDGVAKSMQKLAETLQSKQVNFHFFCPFKPEENNFWMDKVYQVSSLPFLLYPEYRVGIPEKANLQRMLDEFHPDLIHVASPTPMGQFGLRYARKHQIPAVSSYHTHFVDYFKYYGFGLFENQGWSYLKWFYNQFNRIYVPSQNTANQLKQKGFENIELWQRGIELNNFSPEFRNHALRSRIGVTDDEPILLFVGRLVKEKDLEDLIKTNEILMSRQIRFKQVIIGDGPMRSRLKEALPEAHLTGIQRGHELAQWYASSDIFVFPSTTETFGNVILEAYASGLPVIGVDKGGSMDLIQDQQTGFIAKSNTPTDIAQRVQILIENINLRIAMREQALAYAKNFSWEAINGALILSYQKLLSDFSCN